MEGDQKALKAEERALQGEVSNARVCDSSLRGRVEILNSSIGSSDSWRICMRWAWIGKPMVGVC